MSFPPPTGNLEFRDEVVRLAELTVNTLVLEGLTFQNCRILGPAVLVPQGRTSFLHCGFESPDANAIFWEIPPTRTFIVGAIAAMDCTFSSCTFSQIGLAGPPELREQLENFISKGPLDNYSDVECTV